MKIIQHIREPDRYRPIDEQRPVSDRIPGDRQYSKADTWRSD